MGATITFKAKFLNPYLLKQNLTSLSDFLLMLQGKLYLTKRGGKSITWHCGNTLDHGVE